MTPKAVAVALVYAVTSVVAYYYFVTRVFDLETEVAKSNAVMGLFVFLMCCGMVYEFATDRAAFRMIAHNDSQNYEIALEDLYAPESAGLNAVKRS